MFKRLLVALVIVASASIAAPPSAVAHSTYKGQGCSGTYLPQQIDCYVRGETIGGHLYYTYQHRKYTTGSSYEVLHYYTKRIY